MTEIRSGYGPIQFYDAPEVFLTQVLDDEATFGSFVDTFFSPDDLSPQQRDTFTDGMRQDLGIPEKGPGSALLNIATNPLTYLAFLFAPAALASKTGRIFSQSVKNNLTMLWARNGNEMMMGTPGSAAVNRLSQGGACKRIRKHHWPCRAEVCREHGHRPITVSRPNKNQRQNPQSQGRRRQAIDSLPEHGAAQSRRHNRNKLLLSV